ncbi:N-acetylneuraminate synthase family protein [Candidatus Pelagibacter sp.]|uniref:N-acetylneuraminate synthase family protein n=1 Tax=Candidatus Pelagibacter sp. TaxID=2024849 RepID=UPI003F865E7E
MIFISEIGLNYNNNFNLCYELIKQSKLSGADIAKFQLGWRGKPEEINFLDQNRIAQLYDWADYFEIELMFSVFNYDSLNLIKKFKPKKIKIASRTLIDDIKLCQKILDLDIKTFISLGMWEDLENLPFINKNIIYLWCKSTYPNSLNDLKELPKKFDALNHEKIQGFSDHSIGIETALIAISRGATVIEKHFTLDKSNTFIRDHSLSASPDEFRQMVNLGKDIHKKIKNGV